MTEWIVIICWVVPSLNGYSRAIIGNKLWNVYMSSDTTTFSQQWNSLTVEERKNAEVIKGNKFNVLPKLELISKEQPNKKLCENYSYSWNVKCGKIYEHKGLHASHCVTWD